MPKQSVELLKKNLPWYKKRWGIVISALAALFVVFLPFYLVQLHKVYQQFKSGEFIIAEMLEEQAPYKMNNFIDSMSPFFGAPNAPITIVEFGDFNCSKTKAEAAVLKKLALEFESQVKIYWRNFPAIAENSAELAKAGVCAHKQGKFWLFHDYLMWNDGGAEESLSALVQKVGLDEKKFNACFQNQLTLAQIKKDYYAAKDGAVAGTPTFFVNGFKLQGAIPLETWREIINKFVRIYEYEKDNGN